MTPATPMPPPPQPPSAGRSESRTSTSHSRASTSRPTGSTYGSRSASTSYSTGEGRQTRPGTAALSTTSGRRSRAASTLGGSEGHSVVCAVSEARGISPSVGVAFINISTGEAILSQINDTQFYIRTIHKIQVFEPSKILFPSSSCPPNPKSTLVTLIETDLAGVPVVPLNRKYWSEAAGLEFVQALAFKEDVEAIKFSLEGKFYAICSFCAVSFWQRLLSLSYAF